MGGIGNKDIKGLGYVLLVTSILRTVFYFLDQKTSMAN